MRGAQFISLAILLVAVTLACAMPGTYQPTAPTVQIIPTDNYVQPYVQPTVPPTFTPQPVTLSDNYHKPTIEAVVVIVTETVTRMTIPVDSWQYTVKQGDNLHDLAKQYCNDASLYEALLRLNNMSKDDILEIGSVVIISCK